jgi:hypothetical protein
VQEAEIRRISSSRASSAKKKKKQNPITKITREKGIGSVVK